MSDQQPIPSQEIIIASTEEDIQQCYKVRIDVFVHEQRFPLDVEIDHLDPISTHFLMRLTPALAPIGTIRATKSPEGYYKLSRLAVLKPYRQFKFGRALVEALHSWVKADAKQSGQDIPSSVKIVCHSQIPVKGFYAKFGYIPEGAEFDEDGDPHQKMVLEMPLW